VKPTPDGAGVVLEAIRRLVGRGVEPTAQKTRGELLRWRGVGCSMREIHPVLTAWRAAELARRAGVIEAAAGAILLLSSTQERRAVERIVAARSGGGVRVRIVSKARHTGGGRRKKNHTPLHTTPAS
jgi:hypothetical protein